MSLAVDEMALDELAVDEMAVNDLTPHQNLYCTTFHSYNEFCMMLGYSFCIKKIVFSYIFSLILFQ